MGCPNCNGELKHTPGKRKKQFCSPDCRVRYWQKNKPKKNLDKESYPYLMLEKDGQIIRLKSLGITTEGQTFEQAVNAVIFMAGEYKGKCADLEKQLGEMIANSSHLTFKKDMTPHEILEEYGVDAYRKAIAVQNKPNTAPKIEKSGESAPKEKKGKEGAENQSGKKDKESMPSGLSKVDMLKWHRGHR